MAQKIFLIVKVVSIKGEFAPEVQMQPPEVMQVTKRFLLPHLRSRQDGHQQPNQSSDVLLPVGRPVDDYGRLGPVMTLEKKKVPAQKPMQWMPYEKLSTMFDDWGRVPDYLFN